jgi:hypothetical protein
MNRVLELGKEMSERAVEHFNNFEENTQFRHPSGFQVGDIVKLTGDTRYLVIEWMYENGAVELRSCHGDNFVKATKVSLLTLVHRFPDTPIDFGT